MVAQLAYYVPMTVVCIIASDFGLMGSGSKITAKYTYTAMTFVARICIIILMVDLTVITRSAITRTVICYFPVLRHAVIIRMRVLYIEFYRHNTCYFIVICS